MEDVANDQVLDSLRERAEALLNQADTDQLDFSTEKIRRLVHDFSVYQIELELQNEDLRSTQRQLEDSRDRYARLYHQAPVGYLSLDQKGIIRRANQTFTDWLGWPGADRLDLALVDFMTESDRKLFHGRYRTFFNQPTDKSLDVTLHGRNGRSFHAHLTARREPDTAGEPLLLVVVYNIDVHQQLEEKLRITEERYQAIFENSLDIIVITQLAGGKYLDVNQAFVDTVGYERSEAIGRDGIDLNIWVNPADRAYIIEQLRIDRQIRNYETQFRRKNRETFWGLISASLMEVKDIPIVLAVVRDINERKRYEQELQQAHDKLTAANQALHVANAELHQLATTDSLTGVWNRRRFEQAVRVAVERAQRYHEPLALLMFDIDHFKSINDRYGHQTGDQVLIEFSQRVQRNLRVVDGLGRWGGEEFVVILSHSTASDALNLAEKLRALIADQPFAEVGTVTASFGVAEFRSQETLDDWLKRVDDALYQAKAKGRNRVVVAESE